jgi:glycerol kinase
MLRIDGPDAALLHLTALEIDLMGIRERRERMLLTIAGTVLAAEIDAPHWRPDARGLISGLTLDATGAHLARAALESVAFQTRDLAAAMAADGTARAAAIRVDGGMAANDWFCQFLADVLDARVERPAEVETTALGAAFLAGLATGVWPDLAAVAATWASGAQFRPAMASERRESLLAGWQSALGRALAT